MLVDGERVCHALHVEVVGTDEGESPVVLLQLLYHRADHLQSPLLATVLLAIGNHRHQHIVGIRGLCVQLRYSHAHSIVEGRATTGGVVSPCKILGLLGWCVVVMPCGVKAVESHKGDALLLSGKLLLHIAHGLQRFVYARESLTAYNGH